VKPRLGDVAEGRPFGETQEIGRIAEGERDLARRHRLELEEIHVLGREPHLQPGEIAFEEERPTGVARALEAFLELLLDLAPLLLGELRGVARRVGRLEDDRARGARAVLQERQIVRARSLCASMARAAASMRLSPYQSSVG
jgi:hypothetical protein